jgi:hypothetical protein
VDFVVEPDLAGAPDDNVCLFLFAWLCAIGLRTLGA